MKSRNFLKVIVLGCIFDAVLGCSTISRTTEYIPVESSGWLVVDRHKKYEESKSREGSSFTYSINAKATFMCGSRKIEVQEFKGEAIGAFGLPLIPMIPVFGLGSSIMGINYGDGYVEMRLDKQCPRISLGNRKELINGEPYGIYGNPCYYHIDVGGNDFEMKIAMEEMMCDAPPLKFKHQGVWNYAPYIVPHT